jgi:hypothetical protein
MTANFNRMIFLGLSLLCGFAFGQKHPLKVVYVGELPLAVWTAALMKEPVLFQVDTGSPFNILFARNLQVECHSSAMTCEHASQASGVASFFGHSGLWREEPLAWGGDLGARFAIVSIPEKSVGPSGVLGLDAFNRRIVSLNFGKMELTFMALEDEGSQLEVTAAAVEEHMGIRRLMVRTGVSGSGESLPLDTGIAFADVVEILEDERHATSSLDLVIPGIVESISCTRPKLVDLPHPVWRRSFGHHYRSQCLPRSRRMLYPKRIVGIRSIIEAKSTLSLNLKGNTSVTLRRMIQ